MSVSEPRPSSPAPPMAWRTQKPTVCGWWLWKPHGDAAIVCSPVFENFGLCTIVGTKEELIAVHLDGLGGWWAGPFESWEAALAAPPLWVALTAAEANSLTSGETPPELQKARIFGFKKGGSWASLQDWCESKHRPTYALPRLGIVSEVVEWERGSLRCLELRGTDFAALYQISPATIHRLI